MNKTEREKLSSHHSQPLQAEAAVGDYYADPQR